MPPPIRPNVLKMTPYSPGRPIEEVQRELGLSSVIKLASNENPLGPSPKAVAAMQAALPNLHLYPDAATYELRQAIGRFLNVPPETVVPGNGSDELIHLIELTYLGNPEDEVIVGDPSFVRYDAGAYLAPCRLVKVPVTEDLRLDLPGILERITDRTKLIFLANPNNPTGTIYRREEFEAFLKEVPSTVGVVLDEAYFEFAVSEPDYPNGLDYVATHPNVMVLRTFSKSYGLAGLRVGYVVASSEICDAVNRIRAPFNVNSLAQIGAIAALDDQEFLQRGVEHNRVAIHRLSEALRSHGARVFESYANFVLADMGTPAQPIFEALLREGVIVRSGHVLGLPNCLRVSVGTNDEIDRFIEALDVVMTARKTTA